jgi:galactose-1-phosphate uridylyltransferase
MESQQDRLLYLENTIKRIVAALKEKKILDQEFVFLTEEEGQEALKRFVDSVIQGY